jgi:uncharacterized protein (TIGR00369 family)
VTIHEFIANIPYARFVGITVNEENGEARTLMQFRDGLIGNQRLPAIHGGVVGAFLEMAAMIELVHEMGGERIPKPVNFNVNYLRTAGPKDCVARGEVVKLGKRIAHVRVVGWQDDPQRPFGSGYGSFLI